MNLYRNTGITLIVLSALAILFAIGSFPYTDDYFYVGVVGLITLVFSIFLIKWGKGYRVNSKISKKPFWFIVSSFIVAFISPLAIYIFSIMWCRNAFGYECVLGPFFLFLFITGPIGAILFLIGATLLFLQSRKN